MPYQTTDALREFDVGRFEGTASPVGWQEYVDVVRGWIQGDHEQRIGGGESLTETVTRLNRFLQKFVDAEGDERKVACIAHGGLYFAALPHVFSNVSPEFAFQNSRGHNLLITAAVQDGHFVCIDWDGKLPTREGGQASEPSDRPN